MSKSIWVLDPTKSTIGFKIRHLIFATVSGTFTSVASQFELENDVFESARIQFQGEVSSINTNNTERDNHLRGEDFFDVERYPTMTFVSTIIVEKEPGHFSVMGDLTLKGHTQSIVLEVSLSNPTSDLKAQSSLTFVVGGRINRRDYGFHWHTTQETAVMLAGDDVAIVGELEYFKEG